MVDAEDVTEDTVLIRRAIAYVNELYRELTAENGAPSLGTQNQVVEFIRSRHGSEGEDRVYADDAADGYDTLDWIAGQDWCNQRVGMSGSSAGAITTFAAASTRHPSLRAFFAQAGASSIYDDVIYEGQGIEMERLWLWVAKNIPGLSKSHREAVLARFGISAAELDSGAFRRQSALTASPRLAWKNRPLSTRPIGCCCR